jgi:hypothetical protein
MVNSPKPRTQVIRFLAKTRKKAWWLADETGCPRATLYDWLNRDGRLFLDQWERISKFIENKK